MNQEEYLIRKQPNIKILLSDSTFKIHNKNYPGQSVEYYYKDIQNLKIDHNKVDWISTIISYLFVLFGSSSSKTFKDDYLIIHSDNDSRKVSLSGCDLDKVEQAIQKVKERIEVKTYT